MLILSLYTLCNSCLSYIFMACVFVLYIFDKVSHASFGVLASWICTIIESEILIDSQYITFLALSCHPLNAYISCWLGALGIIGSTSFPVMNYQYPFPIRKFVILNFHAWKLFLSSFSVTICERESDAITEHYRILCHYKKHSFSLTRVNLQN